MNERLFDSYLRDDDLDDLNVSIASMNLHVTMNTDVSMTSMKGVAVLLARLNRLDEFALLERLERLLSLERLDDLERFNGNAALSSNSGLELRWTRT